MLKDMNQSGLSGLDHSIQPLQGEYEENQALFDLQPALTQRFIEAQGRQLAEFILQNQSQARFTLPDRVMIDSNSHAGSPLVPVPAEFREQVTGGVIDRLTRTDMRTILRQRLAELEGSNRKVVSISAKLIRFATARHLVYNMLPSGRSVQYFAPEGEEIQSIPSDNPNEVQSAITEQTDAIVEASDDHGQRGELQVPFVPDARRFFLPQWVALSQQGNLLVNSVSDAESHIASIQQYISILHAAVSLAPYFIVDSEYQQKRYGMLGQLVNQGRLMACFQTREIIQVIKRRAATHDLNRGLSLSLPFFDDQMLAIRTHDFTVIPAGRIMFSAAFVVRASHEEQAKVAQDTRLSASTRKYLLIQLKMLGSAFIANSSAASKD